MNGCHLYGYQRRWWKGIFCALLVGLVFSASPVMAERFFKKHSTWYEKIPGNPPIMANSAKHVNFLIGVSKQIVRSYRDWSFVIWRETETTPRYDITIRDRSWRVKQGIISNGWNLNVPIPLDAKPAGYGASDYRDGHMTVISQDGLTAWDFFRADVDNKSAYRVCRWDLQTDGIRQPYAPEITGPTCRVSPTPHLHGLITLKEIQTGYIDHALAFGTHSSKSGSSGVYPSVTSNSGDGTDPWAPQLGFRFQLDPSLDLDSLGLNATGKVVAKALQEYGMIHVINAGPGENIVYFESLDNKTETWVGFLPRISGIPLSSFRLVKPIIPKNVEKGAPLNLRITGPGNG